MKPGAVPGAREEGETMNNEQETRLWQSLAAIADMPVDAFYGLCALRGAVHYLADIGSGDPQSYDFSDEEREQLAALFEDFLRVEAEQLDVCGGHRLDG
jgi:hypothetical protein